MTEYSLLCFLLILCLGSSKIHSFRLPKDVKPVEYDLTIIPNLIEGTYSGKVEIGVNVIRNVDSIILHSKNLQIEDVRINSKKANISTNIPYDFIILSASKPLQKGNHTLKIVFNGDMKNKTFGFFRGYEEENGKQIYFGATFFEPVNARVAFPCFDEPTYKARFTMHIAKPPGYIALSNMNEISHSPAPNGYTYVHFAQTPIMSSYLVFFFVGNYSYVEDYYVKQNKEIIPTRVYSPPSKIAQARYAARQLPKQLQWFVNYTGFDYMLPKLDYITFNPNFHIQGGMENWGAISCREDSIFYSENESVLQTNPLNIAHEFGHIWFGDLLTTSSWTEFWLNEGFGRFMDMKANEAYKERDELLGTFKRVLHHALWRDDDLTAKPLSWKMTNPIDAYQLLNNINYDKGGSVLRMVEDTISKELMQKVVQAYIQKYQYQNVISQNFIDVLQNFVHFNASDFLDGFIRQSGYPLITVKYSTNKKRVILTMERFLRFGQEGKIKSRWSVPIKYTTNLNKNAPLVWFRRSKGRLTLEFASEITWIKLNSKQTGYYRTNYPKEMWKHFSKIIKDFDVEDRMHLIDESLALVRSGHLECSIALDLMNYLSDEERREGWHVAQDGFAQIRRGLLQHNFSISYLLTFITRLIDKPYRKLKWKVEDDESFPAKSTRSTIFNLACYYGHKGCRRKVKQLWKKRNTLPVDIKNILLTNNPNRRIDYNQTAQNDMEMLSDWFGADLSTLPTEPPFRWPKEIMENCQEWLKKTVDGYNNISNII